MDAETETDDRIAWAKTSGPQSESLACEWMWFVVGNTTVQTADFVPTDNDVEYIVGKLITKYGGAAAA